VLLVISAYADQKFKDVDPEMVAGVLRKPFEVGELGSIVRLCVTGFEGDAAPRVRPPAHDLEEASAPN